MGLTLQDRIDHLESLVNLLTDLGTGKDYLAADEDQEDDFGLQDQLAKAEHQIICMLASGRTNLDHAVD